jgi:hypothetical protein
VRVRTDHSELSTDPYVEKLSPTILFVCKSRRGDSKHLRSSDGKIGEVAEVDILGNWTEV